MWRNKAEENLIAGIDRERQGQIPPILEKAHAAAGKLIEEEAINPRSFINRYGTNSVRRDLAVVADLERKFEMTPAKKAAQVLEATMLNAELYNWFGDNAKTIKTSKYDDYVNGVDMIVEFAEPPNAASHLGLAVDVTYSMNAVREKMERIKLEIDHGELAQVKYLDLARKFPRDKSAEVPRVIVGTEWSRIMELANLWMQRKNRELAYHPAQRIILEEAWAQLETFRDYAERTGQRHLLPIFDKDLGIIKSILAEKEAIGQTMFKSDKIFQSIASGLTLFR